MPPLSPKSFKTSYRPSFVVLGLFRPVESPGTGVSWLSSNRSGEAAALGHSRAQKDGEIYKGFNDGRIGTSHVGRIEFVVSYFVGLVSSVVRLSKSLDAVQSVLAVSKGRQRVGFA